MATDEDRKHNIDKWAKLFKADTWETVKELSKKDQYIKEAAKSMYILEQDFEIREQMIRRKEYDKYQRQIQNQLKSVRKNFHESKITIAEQRKSLAEKDDLIEEQGKSLAEKDKSLAEKDKEIAALKAELAKKKA